MTRTDWLELGRSYYYNFTENDLERVMTVIKYVLTSYVKGEKISAYNIEYRMKRDGFKVLSSYCMKAFSLLSHTTLIDYSYDEKYSYLKQVA
ncbi:MAG: hypothetical protein M0Z55_04655 [Peptococcaceae bacterium]|nr:hypothetical protein [Peptococcaceae bacterium]